MLSGKVLTSRPAFIRSSCCRRVGGREQKKLKRRGTLFSPACSTKIYYVVVGDAYPYIGFPQKPKLGFCLVVAVQD